MDLLTGALIATIGVYVFAGPFFARNYLKRSRTRLIDAQAAVESFDFTLLAAVLAGLTLATVLGAVHVASVALVLAFALVGDSLVRGGKGGARVALVHGTASVLALVLLLTPPDPRLALLVYAYGAAIVLALLRVKSRAYLAGTRGNVGVVFGGALLLVALVNDAANAASLLSTAYLAPLGFAVLVAGMGVRVQTDWEALADQLAKREEELRTRRRELQHSYDELRVTQEQLVKKEQLAAVGELAAVIAHEVRNPLAIIANAVSSLRKSSLGEPEREELLRILDDESSRLNRIVVDLLRYARPVTVQRSRVALPELLQRAVQLAGRTPGLKVELEVTAPEVAVWGDANLLRLAFDNLVDNAVHAMGDSGTLTIRVRRSEDWDQGLAVDVVDTGEGMDTAVRQRAKDPFFTTRPSGTGLGLAIVDRIVDAHGGRVSIESKAGQGTRVTVLLPWGTASEPPPSRQSSMAPGVTLGPSSATH